MPRIFISYRRSDSSTISGRIYDHLVREYGDESVFKDVYDIPAGSDFRQVIREAINTCNVQLIIIGTGWVDARSAAGERRLDNPDDFVRIEVESGLTCTDIVLIPVLVSSAPMPSPAELPESLRDLTFRNAVVVRDDPDFRRDIDHLIQSLNRQFAPSVRLERVRRRAPILMATLIFAAVVVTAAVLISREQIRLRFEANSTATAVALLNAQPSQTATVVAALVASPTPSITPTDLSVLPPTQTALPTLSATPTELTALPPTPTPRLTATVLVATDPAGAITLIREGDGLQSQGRYQEALIRYAQAIALDPYNAEAYISRASVYGTLGINFDQAILDANRAIELAPEYLWNYDERGKIYSLMGDYESAIASFTQALRLESYVQGYLGRSSAYAALGDYTDALADLNQAIALDPDSAEAYLSRARVLRTLGVNLNQAMGDVGKAMQIAPDDYHAWDERARIYAAMGQHSAAISSFSLALQMETYAEGYFGRGSAYHALGNNTSALADLSQAIALDPDNIGAYEERGWTERDLGRNGDAIRDFTAAIQREPEGATAYIGRGSAYRDTSRFDEAFADFSQAIALDPNSPDVYYERGYAYELQNEIEEARADYDRALSLDENQAEAHRQLARLDISAGDLQSALKHARRLVELIPEDPDVYALLGDAYYYLGRYDQALPQFRRYAELAGESAQGQYLELINELE